MNTAHTKSLSYRTTPTQTHTPLKTFHTYIRIYILGTAHFTDNVCHFLSMKKIGLANNYSDNTEIQQRRDTPTTIRGRRLSPYHHCTLRILTDKWWCMCVVQKWKCEYKFILHISFHCCCRYVVVAVRCCDVAVRCYSCCLLVLLLCCRSCFLSIVVVHLSYYYCYCFEERGWWPGLSLVVLFHLLSSTPASLVLLPVKCWFLFPLTWPAYPSVNEKKT